jgi:hypothetical protein
MKKCGILALLAVVSLLFIACKGPTGDTGADGEDQLSRSVLFGDRAILAICQGEGYLIGVRGVYCYRSADGVSWSTMSESLPEASAVAYGGGVFVAVGSGIMRSADAGANWSAATLPDGVTIGSITDVAYGAGAFVAVGIDGTESKIALRSADGATWTDVTPDVFKDSSASIDCIDFAGSSFFIGAHDGEMVYLCSSGNGSSWSSPLTELGGSSGTVIGVAYGNGVYLAATSSGEVYSSADGSSWNATALSGASWLSRIDGLCFAEDRFAFLADPDIESSGTESIWWSRNGQYWLLPSIGAFPPIDNVPDSGYLGIMWTTIVDGGAYFVHYQPVY